MDTLRSAQARCGSMQVTELAQKAGVTPATVRYYARQGLLEPVRDPANHYRRFTQHDLRRLEFIRRAQLFGLTIADIRRILATVDQGEAPCATVKSLVAERLRRVREQIAELGATEQRILQLMKDSARLRSDVTQPLEICPLIDRTGAALDRA